MTAFFAILLKPLVMAVFFGLVVWPIVWVLYRLIPPGRIKTFLLRLRDGPTATPEDTRTMHIGMFVAYLLLFVWLGILDWFGYI